MSARKRLASFCPWFRNRYLNGFNTSICFIRRLDFQKTYGYYFFCNRRCFKHSKVFTSSRRFCASRYFFFIKKVTTSKEFSFIKKVFHKQRLFLYQGSFPEAKIIPLSRTFSSTNQEFSFIEEFFVKQIFPLHQGSFPQAKVFPSSRKFLTRKDFLFIKEVYQKQIFSTSQDFSLIKEVFYKQRLFYDHGSFQEAKSFFSEQGSYNHAILEIQYVKGISKGMSINNLKHWELLSVLKKCTLFLTDKYYF